MVIPGPGSVAVIRGRFPLKHKEITMNLKPLPKINARATEWNRYAANKMAGEGVWFRVWRNPFEPKQIEGVVQP